MIPLRAIAFSYLSTHAKIHHRLDTADTKYQRILQDIEKREIRAFADDATYTHLEELKKELLAIKFVEPTSPSP